MIHAHLTTMVLTCILFFITFFQQSKGKKIKVWQMVLRTSYILLIATGVMIFMGIYNITILYIVKAVFGILIIGIFEMVIAWREKDKSLAPLWIILLITFGVLIYLGLKLPMGLFYF